MTITVDLTTTTQTIDVDLTTTTQAITVILGVVEGGGATNLSYIPSPTDGTVTSSTGTDATILAATELDAGLFLPTEKTKLASIQAGAEANVNADWNATEGDALILNKPILGTAAAANVGDFATASQGAKADSALQPADIGVSVQGYSLVLANTTASFTTADEAKLDGIEAGAEVNNISDANATDLTDGGETNLHIHDGRYYTETEINTLLIGKQDTLVSGTNIKTINGSPVLGSGNLIVGGDGQIINGVAHFVRPTAPSVRNDGSALQDNDRWYDSSTGRQWARKGIYWVGERQYIENDYVQMSVTTATNTRLRGVFPSNYLMESFQGHIYYSGLADSSNYCAYSIGSSQGNGTATFFLSNLTTQLQPTAINHAINSAFLSTASRTPLFRIEARTGSPGTQHLSGVFIYREIYA